MELKHYRKITYVECVNSEAELNPEDFRNTSIPYTGDSEDEFRDYLINNFLSLDLEILEELNEEVVKDNLYKLFDCPDWDSVETEDEKHWLE